MSSRAGRADMLEVVFRELERILLEDSGLAEARPGVARSLRRSAHDLRTLLENIQVHGYHLMTRTRARARERGDCGGLVRRDLRPRLDDRVPSPASTGTRTGRGLFLLRASARRTGSFPSTDPRTASFVAGTWQLDRAAPPSGAVRRAPARAAAAGSQRGDRTGRGLCMSSGRRLNACFGEESRC